jgi:hypothetical protein
MNDEEINLEYLRNVVLQFLEHKEMRVRSVSWSHLPLIHLFFIAKSRKGVIHHFAIHTARDAEVDREGVN